jgi:diaminopimelate decarboxylase
MQPQELVKLAEEFGSPLYVYDAEKIQSQYKRLTNAFIKVPRLRINYAAKALSNIAVLQLLKSIGSNLDRDLCRF